MDMLKLFFGFFGNFNEWKSTPLKDRIFALMSWFMFLIVVVATSIILYMNSTNNTLKKENIVLQSKLDLQKDNMLKYNDDCNEAKEEIRRQEREKYEAKIELSQSAEKRLLEEKAVKLEKELGRAIKDMNKFKSKLGINE